MVTESTKKPRTSTEDKYKHAAQDAVDEALAAHNLAPAIKTAITENKPLNDTLQNVIVETVKRNPDMRTALDKAITESNAIKNSQAPYKKLGFWIPIVVTAIFSIIGIILSIISMRRDNSLAPVVQEEIQTKQSDSSPQK